MYFFSLVFLSYAHLGFYSFYTKLRFQICKFKLCKVNLQRKWFEENLQSDLFEIN